MFRKVAIIGVGLIGSSIGLAVKKKKLAKEIVGVCRHAQSLRKAETLGAIDRGTLEYKDAVWDADLVILAAPVREIINTGKKITPYLKPGCVLTDVGSTKQEIVRQIEKAMPDQSHFVGGHPLAGSEKRGAGNACAELFKNALCFLTKSSRTNLMALRKLARFWHSLGCRVRVLTPGEHDQIVAVISHLPHLAAVELVNAAEKKLDFAASGFWDTTRIASSGSEIWTDIFISNTKNTLQALDAYIKRLKLMRRLIAGKDRSRLNSEFKKAKRLRDALPG